MLHDYSPERLRALRKKAMLTQAQVVKETGVCEATLYNLEAGKRRPQTGTLERLLNLYAIRIQLHRNRDKIFEERFNGGYIPGEAIIGFRSSGLHARGIEKEAPAARPLPVAYGLRGVSG